MSAIRDDSTYNVQLIVVTCHAWLCFVSIQYVTGTFHMQAKFDAIFEAALLGCILNCLCNLSAMLAAILGAVHMIPE